MGSSFLMSWRLFELVKKGALEKAPFFLKSQKPKY
jgi:hypothetical protein